MVLALATALTKELDVYTPCILEKGKKCQRKINRRLFFLVEKIVRIGRDFFSNPQEEKLLFTLRYTAKKHQGVYRKDGMTPYLLHPLEVAVILIDLGIHDFKIIIAAILHDVPEDTGTSLKEIGKLFGSGVRNIVSLVTIAPDSMEKKQYLSFVEIGEKALFWKSEEGIILHMKHAFDAVKKEIYWKNMKEEADLNCRWRVIALKFADRIHNVMTLGVMTEEKRLYKLQETRDQFPQLYSVLKKTIEKLYSRRTFKNKKILTVPIVLKKRLEHELKVCSH